MFLKIFTKTIFVCKVASNIKMEEDAAINNPIHFFHNMFYLELATYALLSATLRTHMRQNTFNA